MSAVQLRTINVEEPILSVAITPEPTVALLALLHSGLVSIYWGGPATNGHGGAVLPVTGAAATAAAAAAGSALTYVNGGSEVVMIRSAPNGGVYVTGDSSSALVLRDTASGCELDRVRKGGGAHDMPLSCGYSRWCNRPFPPPTDGACQRIGDRHGRGGQPVPVRRCSLRCRRHLGTARGRIRAAARPAPGCCCTAHRIESRGTVGNVGLPGGGQGGGPGRGWGREARPPPPPPPPAVLAVS